MIKRKNIFIYLLVLVLSITTLTSCVEDDPKIVTYELNKNAPTEITVGSFDVNNYTYTFTYDNGNIEIVNLTEEMLAAGDILKTYHSGTQELTVTYNKQSFPLFITVKQYEFTGVSLVSETIVYDGNYHSLEIDGPIPEGLTISYPKGNSYKNVGKYQITAVLSSDLYVTKEVTGELNIVKADYDTSKLEFNDESFTYDGFEKSISVKNASSDLTITYNIGKIEGNAVTDAGEYTVTAIIDPGMNYNSIEPMTAKLTITKAYYDLSKYKLYDKTVTYTGEPQSITLSNERLLPAGISVVYTGNGVTDAGTYNITANFFGDSTNYYEIDPKEATLTILKADIELDSVYLDSNSFTYDKKPHSLVYSGELPSGVTFSGYENNNQTDVGTYTVKAKFAYKDTVNYNPIEPLTAELIITKATISDYSLPNEVVTYDGFGHSLNFTCSVEGVTATYSKVGLVEPGDYEITVNFEYTDEVLKNYKEIGELRATLSIKKRTLGTSFKDQTYTYDGENHKIEATIDDSERKYIDKIVYTIEEDGNEVEFNGKIEPDQYLVKATFVIKKDMEAEFLKYYESASTEYATLTIDKITYTPKFTNRKLSYTGEMLEVLVDEQDKATYDKLDFTVTYTNNRNQEINIYQGVAKFTLTEEASKYYYDIPDTTFYYAIRVTDSDPIEDNKNKCKYTPSFSNQTVTYDTNPHSIEVKNLIYGIEAEYEGNGIVEPGTYSVKVTFSFSDEIAEWYYTFNNCQYDDTFDEYYKMATLKINKITYSINYLTGPFEYDKTNKEVKTKNLPNWITVTYEYTDEARIIPGEYTVVAKPVITNPEQAIYYQVVDATLTLTISKADPTYTFKETKIKYDGEYHDIEVLGLPDGFSVLTKGGNQKSVGTYDIKAEFIRADESENKESNYYNDIPSQLVRYTIEINVVDITTLKEYSEAVGYKNVRQFSSVLDLFESKINLSGIGFTWSVKYYSDTETINPDPNLQSSSSTANDFIFSESTTGYEYVVLSYDIKLGEGYEFNDSTILNNEYKKTLQLKIDETKKVDITKFLNNFTNESTISQNTKVSQIISSYIGLDKVTYEFTVDYYDGDTKYNSKYSDCHSTSDGGADYTFPRNTWGNKYCLFTYTIKANDGYCLFDGVGSSLTITNSVKLKITSTVNVDLRIANDTLKTNQKVTINEYTSIKEYLESLVDTTYVNIDYEIYDDDVLLASNNELLSVSDDYITNRNLLNLKVKVTYSPKKDDNNKNIRTFLGGDKSDELKKEFSINVNEVEVVDITSLLTTLSSKENTVFNEYDSFTDYYKDLSFPESVTYKVTMIDTDNTVTNYNSIDEIEFLKANDLVADNTITITFTFKATDGYTFLSDGKGVEKETHTYTYKVRKMEKLDISEYTSYIGADKSCEIDKYDDLTAIIKEKLGEAFTKVNIKFTVEYYDDQTLIDLDDDSVIAESPFITFPVKRITTGNEYLRVYYEVTPNVNYSSDLGYVLDQPQRYISNGYVSYTVSDREVIDISNVIDLNNTDINLNQYRTLTSQIETFNINNNLIFKQWTINDGVSTTTKSSANVYTFDKTSDYTVTLEFKTNSGYCYLDSNYVGHETYTLTYTNKINPTTVITLTDDSLDNALDNGVSLYNYFKFKHFYSLFGIDDDMLSNLEVKAVFYQDNVSNSEHTYDTLGPDFSYGTGSPSSDILKNKCTLTITPKAGYTVFYNGVGFEGDELNYDFSVTITEPNLVSATTVSDPDNLEFDFEKGISLDSVIEELFNGEKFDGRLNLSIDCLSNEGDGVIGIIDDYSYTIKSNEETNISISLSKDTIYTYYFTIRPFNNCVIKGFDNEYYGEGDTYTFEFDSTVLSATNVYITDLTDIENNGIYINKNIPIMSQITSHINIDSDKYTATINIIYKTGPSDTISSSNTTYSVSREVSSIEVDITMNDGYLISSQAPNDIKHLYKRHKFTFNVNYIAELACDLNDVLPKILATSSIQEYMYTSPRSIIDSIVGSSTSGLFTMSGGIKISSGGIVSYNSETGITSTYTDSKFTYTLTPLDGYKFLYNNRYYSSFDISFYITVVGRTKIDDDYITDFISDSNQVLISGTKYEDFFSCLKGKVTITDGTVKCGSAGYNITSYNSYGQSMFWDDEFDEYIKSLSLTFVANDGYYFGYDSNYVAITTKTYQRDDIEVVSIDDVVNNYSSSVRQTLYNEYNGFGVSATSGERVFTFDELDYSYTYTVTSFRGDSETTYNSNQDLKLYYNPSSYLPPLTSPFYTIEFKVEGMYICIDNNNCIAIKKYTTTVIVNEWFYKMIG